MPSTQYQRRRHQQTEHYILDFHQCHPGPSNGLSEFSLHCWESASWNLSATDVKLLGECKSSTGQAGFYYGRWFTRSLESSRLGYIFYIIGCLAHDLCPFHHEHHASAIILFCSIWEPLEPLSERECTSVNDKSGDFTMQYWWICQAAATLRSQYLIGWDSSSFRYPSARIFAH